MSDHHNSPKKSRSLQSTDEKGHNSKAQLSYEYPAGGVRPKAIKQIIVFGTIEAGIVIPIPLENLLRVHWDKDGKKHLANVNNGHDKVFEHLSDVPDVLELPNFDNSNVYKDLRKLWTGGSDGQFQQDFTVHSFAHVIALELYKLYLQRWGLTLTDLERNGVDQDTQREMKAIFRSVNLAHISLWNDGIWRLGNGLVRIEEPM